MGTKSTEQIETETWELSTPAEMFLCLEELAAKGYRGQVRLLDTADGQQVWDLEVSATDVATAARLGQTVVLFGDVLQVRETGS